MSEDVKNSEEIEEVESGNDQDAITSKTHFLNPKNIKIEVKQLALQNIIDRLQHEEISFFTEYQRRPDLWKPHQQSLLIESILLQLPLPAFYFDVADDAKWEVVDGLQRLSAINNFVFKSARLVAVEYLQDIENKSFIELPRDMQRRIREFNITTYLISKENPPEVKFNLFKRINTGGLVLTTQEIRHALNTGIAANYLRELAENKMFKTATYNKISSTRMLDRDFINRFLTFYLLGEQTYQDDMDAFMNNALTTLKNKTQEAIVKITVAFEQAMTTAHTIFGEFAFRKRYALDEKIRKQPLNKALFEVLSVSFARLTPVETKELIAKKHIFEQYFVQECNTLAFEDSIARATNNKQNVLHRYATIKKIIQLTINDN